MGESIIRKSKSCFFCGSEVTLEEHHCLHGTANRKKAEQWGLKVYLCYQCHRGTDGVHGKNGHGRDLTLKQAAQCAWMNTYKKSKEDWIGEFGKSYLDLE